MAPLLHQSGEMFGVNFSLADIVCVFLIFFLFLYQQLYIPIAPGLFFLFLSILVLCTAMFYIPYQFMYVSEPKAIFVDYVKLVAIFMYFIVGYNLQRLGWNTLVLKVYAISGFIIGVLGIVFTIVGLPILRDLFYYSEIRYKGLMIDPNYFAILQITSLVYFLRRGGLKTATKLIILLTFFVIILVSGSKTGLITLFLYLTLLSFERFFLERKNPVRLSVYLFLAALFAMLLPVFIEFFKKVISEWGSLLPTFERLQLLFTDFSSAITESGSERDGIWAVALELIQLSPLLGVGVGTYSGLSAQIFHEPHVAHNTFLQLLAEWGIPISMLFFTFVFLLLMKATKSQFKKEASIHEETVIFRDMIIVLLIGSMAVSLNNARILWFLLGALIATVFGKKLQKIGGNHDWKSSSLYISKKTSF